LSSGIPAQVRGNDGVFLTIEQTFVRPGKDVHANEFANFKGISVFARAAYSPPDRNLIDFYADTGIGFNNMLASRPNDRFGFAFAYMHISSGARHYDEDVQTFTGLPTPVRDYEAVFESIYEAHIKDGWLLQPYFQYIFHPAGGAANPLIPGSLSRMRDAAVFGLTTTVKY
jgi:porin